jgi:23S rRNA pseudouridine1911/1915/1917 synthase
MSYLKKWNAKNVLGNYKKQTCKPNDKLIHFIKRNEKNNTSKAHIKEVPDSKLASLDYTIFKN